MQTTAHLTKPESAAVLRVLIAAATANGVTVREILGHRRTVRVARARHASMAAIRGASRFSLHEIARIFSRDHTSVVHAVRRVTGDPDLEALVANLRAAWPQGGDEVLQVPPMPVTLPTP